MNIHIQRNVLLLIGAIAIAVVSFVGGMQAEKGMAHKAAVTSRFNQAAPNGQGGFFGGRGGGGSRFGRPTFGTVKSISGTTMTVTTSGGAAETVSLAGNPQITDSSGNTIQPSGIQSGASVVVFGTAGSDGTITATRIRVNPAGATGSSGSSSSGGATSGI